MRRALIAILVGVFALVAAAGGARAAADPSAPRSARQDVPDWLVGARAQLPKLTVKRAGSMTGYSRGQFGPEWPDVDRNGCDTRNDILQRDLVDVVFRAGSDCVVASGTLNDRYTGTTINFVRGPSTSLAVQIDHVVALAAAWRTGARRWTDRKRRRYANDRLVLLAAHGPTNGAKGDRDAARWLPPNVAFHCRYVARQISIKRKYRLWVTRSERRAMTRTLDGC